MVLTALELVYQLDGDLVFDAHQACQGGLGQAEIAEGNGGQRTSRNGGRTRVNGSDAAERNRLGDTMNRQVAGE